MNNTVKELMDKGLLTHEDVVEYLKEYNASIKKPGKKSKGLILKQFQTNLMKTRKGKSFSQFDNGTF